MADIKFQCAGCGQSLEAPADIAGSSIECPACNMAITVPAAQGGAMQPAPTPATTEGGSNRSSRCPKCSAEIQAGAVLCVHCGYHFKKRKQLKTKEGTAKTSGGKNTAVVIGLVVLIVAVLAFMVWKVIKSVPL